MTSLDVLSHAVLHCNHVIAKQKTDTAFPWLRLSFSEMLFRVVWWKLECMELSPHFSIPGAYIRENLANTLGTSRNYFATRHFGSINTSLIISESHVVIAQTQCTWTGKAVWCMESCLFGTTVVIRRPEGRVHQGFSKSPAITADKREVRICTSLQVTVK
jgi:hypothetical protein